MRGCIRYGPFSFCTCIVVCVCVARVCCWVTIERWPMVQRAWTTNAGTSMPQALWCLVMALTVRWGIGHATNMVAMPLVTGRDAPFATNLAAMAALENNSEKNKLAYNASGMQSKRLALEQRLTYQVQAKRSPKRMQQAKPALALTPSSLQRTNGWWPRTSVLLLQAPQPPSIIALLPISGM